MAYLIGQIVLCLVAGTALGVAIGWLLQTATQSQKLEDLESWKARLATQEQAAATTSRQLGEQTANAERLLREALGERDQRVLALEQGMHTKLVELDKRVVEFEPLQKTPEQITDLQSRVAAMEPLRKTTDQIAALDERVGALEPLQKTTDQIRGLENRIAAVEPLRKVTDQIAALDERVGALEPLQKTTDQIRGLENRIAAVEPLRKTTDQIRGLENRIAAVEPLRKTTDQIATLDQRIGGLEHLREVTGQIGNLDKRVTGLEPVLRATEQINRRVSERDTEFEKVAASQKAATEQLGKLERTYGQLLPLRETATKVSELERQIAALKARPHPGEDLNSRIRDLETGLEATLREKNAEIEKLKRFSRDIEPILAATEQREARLRSLELRYETLLGERRSEISPRAPKSAAALPPKSRGEGAKVEKDDLKRIYGIGPVLERTLNRLGIHTYRQVASWTAADIEKVSSELGTFPDRVRRDRWVEGAREQHELKYGQKT